MVISDGGCLFCGAGVRPWLALQMICHCSRPHDECLQCSLSQSGSDPNFYSFKFYYPVGTVLTHSFIIHFFMTYSFTLTLSKLLLSQKVIVT